MNQELPVSRLALEKTEKSEIRVPTLAESKRKQGNSRKSICLCFIDYAKAFDCMDHNTLWKALKEITPNYLSCLLRNLYVGQEAKVSTGHGTTDWFSIEKGVRQGCLVFI